MNEPDVTLTDFLLALECAVLVALLIGQPAADPYLKFWFVVFFAVTGVASAQGGMVHGYFSAESSRFGASLWTGTLLAIGLGSLACWVIGARLLWPDLDARLVLLAAVAEFAGYALVVIVLTRAFSIAIANYFPAVLFLAAGLWASYQSEPNLAVASGLGSLALMVVAGVGQVRRIGIHPRYFNHNALFHVLQGVALVLLYAAARRLL